MGVACVTSLIGFGWACRVLMGGFDCLCRHEGLELHWDWVSGGIGEGCG